MPKVPTLDNFRVTPTVGGSGPVDLGMSAEQATVGARQLQGLGDAISNTGQRAANIEIDALQQANQLRVDDGLNQLKEKSLKARYDPQIGFENIRGVDALQRKSGQSLSDEYGSLLEKDASDIEITLGNDAQRAAFRKNANNILLSFKGDATQHEAKEFQTYAISVRDGTIKNRMNEIGLNYNNPEVVESAVKSIAAATYDQGRLLGKSAEWSEAQSRDATSKAHTTAIMTALQKNDPTYADSYLKKFSKDMNADDILQVNGHLTKQLDGQIGLQTANSVIQEVGPKIVTSDSDRAFNIAVGTESSYRQFDKNGKPLQNVNRNGTSDFGIAQVNENTAQEAAKLAGLPWDEEKYKNDEKYNYALGKAYFDKQLKDNGGNVAMAYAGYNAGPGALKKAIETATAKGAPDTWRDYLPASTQNYVDKNMKAYNVGGGNFNKPTLMDVQNAVREKVGTGSPERLKIALDETERQYKAIEEATKQKNDEAKANAMRSVMENGGRFADLPIDIRGALAPDDVTKVMEFAKKISNGDDNTNLAVYQELSTDPQSLKNLTDPQFFALRSELSESDFKHFTNERAKLISGKVSDGPGDLNTAAIKSVLDDRLNSMGIVTSGKDSDPQQLGAIRRYINESVGIEQANRGKKMNDTEVSGFIDTLFAQQITRKGWLWDSTSPLVTQTVSQIPSATKDSIKAGFKLRGIEQPSEADILNAYLHITSKNQMKEQNGKSNSAGDSGT